MRSVMVVVVLVAACGGGDDGVDGGGGGSSSNVQLICEDMQKAVTQRRGACRLLSAPTDRTDPFGNTCPWTYDAWCGDEADCPAGWGLSCDQAPDGTGINCTYGTSSPCDRVSGDTIEFDFVQTLNGVDGLTVLLVDGGGSRSSVCEFRPCL